MKQVSKDRSKVFPFILCTVVILLNVISVLFGREIYRYIGRFEEYYYYHYCRENVLFLTCYILPPVASAVLMMVQILSKKGDQKRRVLLSIFYFFMAGGQFFFGAYTFPLVTEEAIYFVLISLFPAVLLAMIIIILTGKAKKWMYTAISVAGMGMIAITVLIHYINADVNFVYPHLLWYWDLPGGSLLVTILEYISMFLLYAVILVYKNGKVTGKLVLPDKKMKTGAGYIETAEQELIRLLSQRNDGTISEEEYNQRRAEIIRRL